MPPYAKLTKFRAFATLALFIIVCNANISSAQETLSFTTTEDVFVRSSQPNTNYSSALYIRIRTSSVGEHVSYLKFDLKGLNRRSVKKATLRLYVIQGGRSGGTVFPVSSKFKDSDLAWDEKNLTYENAPPIIHDELSSLGEVKLGETVEFDVTAAVEVDGKRSFAIRSDFHDLVRYSTKEGVQAPELIIETGPRIPLPAITGFDPNGGLIGDEVLVKGENFISVSDVQFNGVSIEPFEVLSESSLSFRVPENASSGKIRVVTEFGEAESSEDFFVALPPTIQSFFPTQGPPGTEVAIIGTNLGGLSDVFFNGDPAAQFEFDSNGQVRAVAPGFATSGPVSVQNAAGTATSFETFTVTQPATKLTLNPIHDTFVRSAKPTTNYALLGDLSVRKPGSDVINSYLKFRVLGSGNSIKSAILRLVVLEGSEDGGHLFQVSNNYADTDEAWQESGLLFGNAPAITGDPVTSIGDVEIGETIEIDLTEIITGDGEYSFALSNEINDLVIYSSKEGSHPPVLDIETNFVNTRLPVIVTFSPESGTEGTEVVIRGRNLDEATGVSFNGVQALDYTIDGPTQIRATVPLGATRGKISISDPDGPGISVNDFTVVLPPTFASFEPQEGTPGTEVIISGTNLLNVADISFNGHQATSFQADSGSRLTAIVPLDATTGPIQISNDAGTAVSASDFTVRDLPSSVTLLPTDDSFVRSSQPTTLYGEDDDLLVRRSSKAEYLAYLKFKVAGLGEAIRTAKLRLFVLNGSDQGGELYAASNNFSGSNEPWNEDELNYENAPGFTAGPMADLGETTSGETVEVDVSSIVTRDGTYTFVFKNDSNDLSNFSSKEGVQPPELFIKTLAGQNGSGGDGGNGDDDKPNPGVNAPVVSGFSPAASLPGSVVTISGSKFTNVTGVAFNDMPTISFVADSPSQIRATVPFGATTGKVSVTNASGTGTSSQDFVIPGPPSITAVNPEEGLPGTPVIISGSNFARLATVTFDGLAASFQVDSDSQVTAEVPAAAQSGIIRVSNSIGSAESTTEFTVLVADTSDSTDTTDPTDPTDPDPNELTVELLEDAYVRSNRPERTVGDAAELRVRRSSGADYNSYLKFRVSGLSESVRNATLKLFVLDGSSSGGEVYSVSNNFQGSGDAWDEENLNFENAPSLDGSVLSSVGRVEAGAFAEFDVSAAIAGDGTYSFAISNDVNDLVNYSAKEGDVAPELIIETGKAPSNAPIISGFSPGAGTVGTEVTLFGEKFIGSISSGKTIQGTVKIMPLGNSITQGVHGSTDDAGYRNDLAELLNSQNIDFNFVGSKQNGRGFDRQHEGHSGFRADELLAEVDAYLRRNPPNMILLHIGTNDISEKQSNSGTIDEIGEILDRIHNFDSDIVTILSSIVPRRGSKNSQTEQLNNLIGDLISEKQSDGYNLHYAGNNEAFVANPDWETEYMDDTVHPSDLGYAVMAGVWLDSIVEVLGGGTTKSTLAVAFGGQQASQIIIDSKTEIRATVPAGASSGKITVTTKHGTASSPTNFEVVGSAALALTFPRGGELWQSGSTHSIVWKSAPDIERVNLEYSPDSGKSWLPIVAGAANTGRYIWQTPDHSANEVYVRISDFGNGGAAALSEGTLALVSEPKAVELLSLNQIKNTALGKITDGGLTLGSADLNQDGNVDLLDVLNAIDYGEDSVHRPSLAKSSDRIEQNASARFTMENLKKNGNRIDVPFTLDSNVPIRGFQVKFRYDGARLTDLMPQVDPDLNLILDYQVHDGQIEVMGYLKKENGAVQIDGTLLTLTGLLHRADDSAVIEVVEALFVSRNLKSISLEAEAESTSEVPSEFQLHQNFPNPFNLGTRITFNVPSKSKVSLKIYNLRGEVVRTLVNEEREPGLHRVSWNGNNESGITVASGVYVYRLSAGDFDDTRKLTLVK